MWHLISNAVTPVDLATNTAETPIPVGRFPVAVAVTADGATAYVTKSSPIATYQWNFGDGQTVTTLAPTATHVYGAKGTYSVTSRN